MRGLRLETTLTMEVPARGRALPAVTAVGLGWNVPVQDPINRRIAWTGDVLRFLSLSGDWRTVVGVVGDVRDAGPDAPPLPAVY